ncbi:MAG: NAD-dependent epimerase/dehydratase family protein [Actinomycetota bacterium]|nr:MAG: NAD-dependent epimerase/dehydratase family protein [Actinomycetota bacterium]
MIALVTGSAGFVGRHTVRALRDRGWDVHGIDLALSADCTVASVSDVRHFFRLDDRRFDLVVHCAAVVGGRAMIDGSPLQLAAEDLSIDAEMWRWALRTRPGRVVYFSSAAAYPTWLQTDDAIAALLEDDIDLGAGHHLGRPDQTYGWVKLTGELLAVHAREQGLAVTVLRPFSGYGGDQALDYPFPSILARAVAREDPLDVWSDTVRDFVHVDDVVACTLAAVEAGVDGPLNICTGVATSFSQLAHLAASVVGYEPEVRVLEGYPTGVRYRVGDPTKMLGVFPPVVTIADGVNTAVKGLS